jgi:DNA-binding LytR/AlgR family response regulator
MIKAIAIDDEPLALEIIENYCSKSDIITLERTFTKVSEALKYFNKFPVDLLFLDIHMPSISGIDFYKSLQKETMVIFTTAHSEYAIEGFNLNAIDFLLKPYSLERFNAAVKKADDYYKYTQNSNTEKPNFIYVRADYSLFQIAIDDIFYIESFADYLDIHIDNQKKITTRMTMKMILEKLPEKDFARVHRSYIIPVKRIAQIRNKIVYIADKEFPIGSSYESHFFSLIEGQ